MDVVSHALWGGLAFGRASRRDYLLAVFCALLPDFSSFGIFFVGTILGFHKGPDWSAGPPPMEAIPSYVQTLYNISHSLVTFAVIFGLIWLVRKKPFWPFAAYGLSVLVDIPTHSLDFFPTPFLWPLSDYRFDGVSWGEPWIFFSNIGLLIAAYAIWTLYSRLRKRKS